MADSSNQIPEINRKCDLILQEIRTRKTTAIDSMIQTQGINTEIVHKYIDKLERENERLKESNQLHITNLEELRRENDELKARVVELEGKNYSFAIFVRFLLCNTLHAPT